MLITKEQQEALIINYAKNRKSPDEVCGFIDGIIAMMDLIGRLDKQDKENKKLTNSNHGE